VSSDVNSPSELSAALWFPRLFPINHPASHTRFRPQIANSPSDAVPKPLSTSSRGSVVDLFNLHFSSYLDIASQIIAFALPVPPFSRVRHSFKHEVSNITFRSSQPICRGDGLKLCRRGHRPRIRRPQSPTGAPTHESPSTSHSLCHLPQPACLPIATSAHNKPLNSVTPTNTPPGLHARPRRRRRPAHNQHRRPEAALPGRQQRLHRLRVGGQPLVRRPAQRVRQDRERQGAQQRAEGDGLRRADGRVQGGAEERDGHELCCQDEQ